MSSLDTGLDFSTGRVAAMVRRYWYLLSSSWPRILDLIYWPTVQMLMWGFLQTYVSQQAGFFAQAAGVFIGSVLLWDILFRGQLGFTFTFLEDIWSRNVANLMMSPLTSLELAASLMLMSLIRLLIGTIPVTILALVLFGFNIYGLGFGLLAFFVNLVLTGWAIGLIVCGLVIRHGLGAESLAFSVVILLMPLCCVYYPVWVLPTWLQPVAWMLAPTYVFEGMRGVLLDHVFRMDLAVESLMINLVYLAMGFASFLFLLRSARYSGSLLTMGE